MCLCGCIGGEAVTGDERCRLATGRAAPFRAGPRTALGAVVRGHRRWSRRPFGPDWCSLSWGFRLGLFLEGGFGFLVDDRQLVLVAVGLELRGVHGAGPRG